MMEKLEALQIGCYGRLEEVLEDIKEAGFEIEEANREYITASYEEGDVTVYIDVRLGGTERTITIDRVTEVDRM